MKWFVAVLLVALFAIVMAVEQAPEVKKVATEKETTDAARDKRGLVYGSAYAPLSYASPYAYSYPYSLPYAYSSYAYPSYYRYPYYSSPYIVV
ncbi:uncharacterized protein LOC114929627 [Nylanderia fulva]|uniref:uncharacterized protein LOC114929627 n=1 Tax=Nylanderia fulva TaxID=613905 RepID=UPI0010FB064A|nr:uncharacterized protein LOC114929627 [Nylanderia fulva]